MQSTLEWVGPHPRIAIESAGAGATVIFLHGVGGNRGNWRLQLAAFAARFHCIAFDMRGYGDSDDFSGPLSWADLAGDLQRVLDHSRAERAHIVGLSMGGMLAQYFWRHHSARVASLVLCDTASGPEDGLTAQWRADFLRARKAPLLAGRTPRDIAPAVAPALASPRASESAVLDLIKSIAALRTASYVKALEIVAAWEGIGDLASIDVPTLVVVGEDDRLMPLQMSRNMAARIPGAHLAVVAGAGHLPNIERPVEFNAAVLDFLVRSER